MLHTLDIVLPLESSEQDDARKLAAAKMLGIDSSRVRGMRLRKHSIDARQRQVKVQLRIEVAVDEDLPDEPKPIWSAPALSADAKKILIIGAGPAGLFAALRCLELGQKPVILERGKDASSRRFDLAPILREGLRRRAGGQPKSRPPSKCRWMWKTVCPAAALQFIVTL